MNIDKRVTAMGLVIVMLMSLTGGWAAAQDNTLPLTETYVLKSGYSVNYPQGWIAFDEFNEVVSGSGTQIDNTRIKLSSNERIAEVGYSGDFEPGDAWLRLSWQALYLAGIDPSANASLTEILSRRLAADMGEPYEIQLGETTAAIAEGEDEETGHSKALLIFFRDYKTLCSIFMYTAAGEYDQFRPTLLAIAESTLPSTTPATASAPPAEPLPLIETYTLKNDYSFSYPAGWAVDYELNEPDMSLAQLGSNATLAQQGGFGYDFAPGDVWVAFTWEALGNFSDVNAESSPVDVLNASVIRLYPNMSDPYEIPLGDRTAAIVEGLHSSGKPMMAIFFFWDENTIGWFIALTAPDEYELFKPTLLSIAESALPDADVATFQPDNSLDNATDAETGSAGPDLGALVSTLNEPATESVTTPPSVNEPTDSAINTPNISPPSTMVEYRQWAARAQATSQYTATDWSAQQATGAPNTAGCGDIGTAWASSNANGIETLTVFFSTPVIPTAINIYQTYNPGAITNVDLIPAESGPVISLPNSADLNTGCPGVFTVDVPANLVEGQLVTGVAIRLDQRNHIGWNEIDAVELVGETEAAAITSNQAETATLPSLPAAVACNVQARSRVNLRGGPGTSYNVAGQLRYGTVMPANGQTTGQDGYTWWRLTYGGWVRGDVVDAAANCSSTLPRVSAADPLPLTQRYVTPEGFALDYPQDWALIEEPGGATIGNSWDAAQNPFGEPFYAGEFQASIRWLTINELVPDTGLATGATSMQVLRAAISVSAGLDMNEPYELQIGNQVVAAAYGTFYDTDVEIAVVIFEAKDGLYGSILTGSDLRGLEQFEPTLRAIIASALAGSN